MKFIFAIICLVPPLSFALDEKGTDREEVRQVIRKHTTEFKNCYSEGVKKNPSLEGKVVIEFDIADNGSVSKAAVQSATLSDEAVQSCIISKIMTMKFPPPPMGTIAGVRYPFIFSKAKK